MPLAEFFEENKKAAIAFSGGVDSAYLLKAAVDCGADVRPYFIKTPFQPEFELRAARMISRQSGVSLTVVELDILGPCEIISNPQNRCYYCNKAMFTELLARAKIENTILGLRHGRRRGYADRRPAGVVPGPCGFC